MEEKLIPIEGSLPTNNNQKVGLLSTETALTVLVKLRRKSQEGLPTLAEFLAGKRVRLTRQQLEEKYGASQADVDAVTTWAKTKGLTVTETDLGRRLIKLEGHAEAMNAAFSVTLSEYVHARTGVKFHSPESDIHIPESLAGIITGVFGLNNMPVVTRRPIRLKTAMAAAEDPKDQFPGSFYPHEVSKLYNFPPSQGAGQKVAILEFGGGFDPAALNTYFTTNIGLPRAPVVNSVSVLGVQNTPDLDVSGEVYLDIEVVGAMAPAAEQDVYFAPWSGAGYLAAIDQAVHADDYAAVSISYGLDEDARGSTGNAGWPSLHKSVDEAFQDASAIGLPVFVSSGDQGSSSGRGTFEGEEVTEFLPQAHAAYPCTSPYVTAVGGTMLYAADGAITNEIVWNELGQLVENKYYLGGATGGGVSDRYSTVPSYQSGAGIDPRSINPGGATGRAVPDVAGNAGATTGYLVTQPTQQGNQILPVGGTSAAAPMWAALMACVRESLTAPVPVFFFNDFVYAKGNTNAFQDIVKGRELTYNDSGVVLGDFTPTGNNQSSKEVGYTSGPGYDCCTGWGSPNGANLLAELQAWLATQPH